ncbi:MAG: hypothetical protein MK212_07615 [Saprospiraceae bacterium]|nr:hypothetical protein [Saprospiraceae bacterium]
MSYTILFKHTKFYIFAIGLLFFGNGLEVSAQTNKRFMNGYPLATPSDSRFENEAELKQTMTALIGGARMLASGLSSAGKDDGEAFSKQDYLEIIDQMVVYADELAIKAKGSSSADTWNKDKKSITKGLKGGQYDKARSGLKACGGVDDKDAERIFFIWKDYLGEKDAALPWLDAKNIKITRIYRSLLDHVSKKYEKPFGPFAEQGAILADAMQALSNSLEDPSELAWQGEGKFTLLRSEDELKRLASNVVYYEWKLHDPINATRSAQIKREQVRVVKLALYDVVRSMVERKTDWDKDPSHGKNLVHLYEATLEHGWKVNGNKAEANK